MSSLRTINLNGFLMLETNWSKFTRSIQSLEVQYLKLRIFGVFDKGNLWVRDYKHMGFTCILGSVSIVVNSYGDEDF